MPTFDDLIQAVKETRNFLLSFDEKHWASKLSEIIRSHGQNESEELQRIRGLFGGMGSLGDLKIAKVNGHQIELDQEKDANRKLNFLCDNLFETLKELDR
jgi:hypothetical protein